MEMRKKESNSNPKWFGYALQGLVFLATHDQNVCPSGQMAAHLEAQATMMRRIMAPLAKANLVEAKEGRDGGYRLAKSANQITLADVYLAVQMAEPLSLGLLESTSDGLFGKEMHATFMDIVMDIEEVVVESLRRRTIADLIHNIDNTTEK